MGFSIGRCAVIAAAVLSLAGILPVGDAVGQAANTITALEVQEDGTLTRIVLSGAEDPIYTAFMREDPPRLIIELPNVTFEGIDTPQSVRNGVVREIDVEALGEPGVSPSLTRISIILEAESEYDLIPNGSELLVELRPLVAHTVTQPETRLVSRSAESEAPTDESEAALSAATEDGMAAADSAETGDAATGPN